MKITFQHIQVLIDHYEEDNGSLNVTFSVPNSDQKIQSQSNIKRSLAPKSYVSSMAKRSVVAEIRRIALRAVRSFFGRGTVGRIGTSVANAAMTTMNKQAHHSYSEAEKQAAIVEAYQKVASEFYFDNHQGEWKAASALSFFEQQLQTNPIQTKYEQEILARTLAVIAMISGDITRDEREFLTEMIGEEAFYLDDLMADGAPSKIECEEVAKGVDKSIYMVAWVMALTDHSLENHELEILSDLALYFGFANTVKNELRDAAKIYTIENLTMLGYPKSDIFQFADQISMSRADAERAMIRYRKRNG